MSRSDANMQAQRLNEKFSWVANSSKLATAFTTDQYSINYISLADKTNTKLQDMLSAGIYQPYNWQVRLFNQQKIHAVNVSFTPDGKPYNFRLTLPDAEKGNNISSVDAQKLAENQATKYWNVNLKNYKKIDYSQNTQPSGRIDHSFTYERPDKIIEGNYRLQLTVKGDILAGVKNYIKIPESFQRKYSNMRSYNNNIALFAIIMGYIIYLTGGIIGLIYLNNRNWTIWKPGIIFSCLIGLASGLDQLNSFPTLWIYYDTVTTYASFISQEVIFAFTIAIFSAISTAFALLAAENLTRYAFPNKIQFWRLWQKNSAPTAVLGQTIGGLLLPGIWILYIGVFYAITTKYFGFWSPPETLYDPNILANYIPWYSALAKSLSAGVVEECLFRAIPLAGAVILGNKFGHKKTLIIATLLLQALLFAAAHANYPAQPSYARVLEIFIPAIGFGLLYLYYGLLPGIILHFVLDAVLFGLPIYNTVGNISYKLVLSLIILFPLWVILFRRYRVGNWQKLDKSLLNSAWIPAKISLKNIDSARKVILSNISRSLTITLAIIALATIPIIIWLSSLSFNGSKPLVLTKSAAIEIANNTLSSKNIQLDDTWKISSYSHTNFEQSHKFVWTQLSKSIYQELLGSYLALPSWEVRYAKFTGDISLRAEEYRVVINNASQAKLVHILPEDQPGKSLTESDAKELVLNFINQKYNLHKDSLKLVDATSSKQPKRLDWTFIYQDTRYNDLKSAQARISVVITGNKIQNYGRYIYTPEAWEREQAAEKASSATYYSIIVIAGVLLGFAAIILSLYNWRKLNKRIFLMLISICSITILLSSINYIPSTLYAFNTTESYGLQILQTSAIYLIGSVFTAITIALISSYNALLLPIKKNSSLTSTWIIGATCALIYIASTYAFNLLVFPYNQFYFPEVSAANAIFPYLSKSIQIPYTLQESIVSQLFVFLLAEKISNGWQKKAWLGGLILITGTFLANIPSPPNHSVFEMVTTAIIPTILLTIGYILVFRKNHTSLISMLAIISIAPAIKLMQAPAYVGAFPDDCIYIILTLAFAHYVIKIFDTQSSKD